MELIKTQTRSSQFGINDKQLVSQCIAIEIANQSDDDRSPDTGESIGYRLIINNGRTLLPGQSWSISMPFGYIDDTMYNVTFKAVSGTPSNSQAQGCVTRTTI